MRIGLKILCVALITAPGCSGDDGGANGSGGGSTREGVFLDSAVSGMGFSVGEESGTTDSKGTFQYPRGAAQIDFTIGDIAIGSGTPSSRMTPLDLVSGAFDVTDNEVTNIARLLQTIDDDASSGNGIAITQAVRDAAAGQNMNFDQDTSSFENDGNVQTVVQNLTGETQAGERNLIDAATAQQHLSDTITASRAGSYSGKYCLDAENEGGQQATAGNWSMDIDADGVVSISFTGTPSFSATGAAGTGGTFEATGPGDEYVFGNLDGNSVGGRWYAGDSSGTFSEDGNCNDSD